MTVIYEGKQPRGSEESRGWLLLFLVGVEMRMRGFLTKSLFYTYWYWARNCGKRMSPWNGESSGSDLPPYSFSLSPTYHDSAHFFAHFLCTYHNYHYICPVISHELTILICSIAARTGPSKCVRANIGTWDLRFRRRFPVVPIGWSRPEQRMVKACAFLMPISMCSFPIDWKK